MPPVIQEILNLLAKLGINQGMIPLIVIGVILFLQWKNGNLGKLFASFGGSGGSPDPDAIRKAVDAHITALEDERPETLAYESALFLTQYFENDPEGHAAAVKCGERLFHVKPPDPPEPDA